MAWSPSGEERLCEARPPIAGDGLVSEFAVMNHPLSGLPATGELTGPRPANVAEV